MELKTMVLDGIEYVLIPKDVFEQSVGVPVTAEPETPINNGLSDFIPEESLSEETPNESVKVVSEIPNVRQAQGQVYGYALRLREQKLLPEDIMVLRTNMSEMPETPEIARNDFKDKNSKGLQSAKWGFYGPGAERDNG